MLNVQIGACTVITKLTHLFKYLKFHKMVPRLKAYMRSTQFTMRPLEKTNTFSSLTNQMYNCMCIPEWTGRYSLYLKERGSNHCRQVKRGLFYPIFSVGILAVIRKRIANACWHKLCSESSSTLALVRADSKLLKWKKPVIHTHRDILLRLMEKCLNDVDTKCTTSFRILLLHWLFAPASLWSLLLALLLSSDYVLWFVVCSFGFGCNNLPSSGGSIAIYPLHKYWSCSWHVHLWRRPKESSWNPGCENKLPWATVNTTSLTITPGHESSLQTAVI